MSGLGASMAGGNPGTAGRQGDDFYPTPPEVTRALLSVERFQGLVWEPACGDGAIVRVLVSAGLRVSASDIITNPPFMLAEKFIRRALYWRPAKLALVLKSTYWHAAGRQALFREFTPARVYPLTWRPDFLGLGRPTMEVQWCVWDADHDGSPPRYIPLSKEAAQ